MLCSGELDDSWRKVSIAMGTQGNRSVLSCGYARTRLCSGCVGRGWLDGRRQAGIGAVLVDLLVGDAAVLHTLRFGRRSPLRGVIRVHVL